MALKATLDDVKDRLDALLTYANGVTGESDTSIGDAIETLADGYGQGGDSEEIYKAFLDSSGTEELVCPLTTIRKSGGTYMYARVIRCPNLTSVGQSAFQNNTFVEELYLPQLSASVTAQNLNYGCTKLKVMDSGYSLRSANGWFTNCTLLDTLILHAFVEPIRSTAFSNSKFAPDGAGGYVYVPQALLSQFQNSANWQNNANVIEFRTIEGSIYE